jgi:hypothetical protein
MVGFTNPNIFSIKIQQAARRFVWKTSNVIFADVPFYS